MKRYIFLFVVLALFASMSGCSQLHGPIKPLGKGAVACHSDAQCKVGWHCGFPDVDTMPQCVAGFATIDDWPEMN
jgi:hypothetical protein